MTKNDILSIIIPVLVSIMAITAASMPLILSKKNQNKGELPNKPPFPIVGSITSNDNGACLDTTFYNMLIKANQLGIDPKLKFEGSTKNPNSKPGGKIYEQNNIDAEL